MLSLAIAALGVPSSGRAGLGVQAVNRSFLAARCPECSEEGIDALDLDDVERLTAEVHRAELAGRAVSLYSMQLGVYRAPHFDASKCYNECSGHGTCTRGLCACEDSFGAADCAEGQPHEETEDAFVYVYEMPPELGLSQLRQKFGDPLYAAEAFFLEKLMSDGAVRTTDPRKARVFYVPTHIYYAINNVAFAGQHFEENLRPHLTYWGMNPAAPNGEDHVFFFTNDKGACGAPRGPIYITQFGYMKPWECMGREMEAYCPRADASEKSCTDERSIVTPSYGFSASALDTEIVRDVVRSLPKDADGYPVYPYLLSFAGGIRSKDAPMYSQNVRQLVHAWYSENNDRFSITEGLAPIDIFGLSKFCLAPSGDGWGVRLAKSLIVGCVPLIIQPSVRQPFDDLLNYSEFALTLEAGDIPNLQAILEGVTPAEHARMLRKGRKVATAFYYEDQTSEGRSGIASSLIVQQLRERASRFEPWTIPRATITRAARAAVMERKLGLKIRSNYDISPMRAYMTSAELQAVRAPDSSRRQSHVRE